jgi:hypothetical protein
MHDNQGKLTLWAAKTYLRIGLSVVPIRRDGSKTPACREWKPYQEALPTLDEVEEWFDCPVPPGIAIIGGAVSGGLECIDFDYQADVVFALWCELVEDECPGPVGRLNIVQTPRQPAGYHVRYRCTEAVIPGNTKLSSDPFTPGGKQVLIETRGTNGYALAPGCPPECHETGRTYEHYSGPKLSQVETITAAEREVLIRCAMSFNKDVPDSSEKNGTGSAGRGTDMHEKL